MFVVNQWFSETPSRTGGTKNMLLKETTHFSKQSKIGHANKKLTICKYRKEP